MTIGVGNRDQFVGDFCPVVSQVHLPVNGNDRTFLLFLQFVFEGVRGKGVLGDIAIDDISVMDSCPPRGESLVY